MGLLSFELSRLAHQISVTRGLGPVSLWGRNTLIHDFLSERARVRVEVSQIGSIFPRLFQKCPSSRVRLHNLSYPSTLHSFLSVRKQVTIADSALSAAQNSEVVVVATEWKEFRDITGAPCMTPWKKRAFVFDGRMILDVDALRKIGFKVTTIGRGDKY